MTRLLAAGIMLAVVSPAHTQELSACKKQMRNIVTLMEEYNEYSKVNLRYPGAKRRIGSLRTALSIGRIQCNADAEAIIIINKVEDNVDAIENGLDKMAGVK